MNEQAGKLINEMRCSVLVRKPRELRRNDVAATLLKWLISNSLDNNDPCMLRHTAGCSFGYIDEDKSSLIDLETYDCAA